jgi:hypothetical protein
VSLALGSTAVRARLALIRTHLFNPSIVLTPQSILAISVLGSLVIHIAATALTAHILQSSDGGYDSDSRSSILQRMMLLWFARPLATPIVIWLSIVSRAQYAPNSSEIGLTDTIYSLVSVYLVGAIARITNVSNVQPRPARMARAGSALWLLWLILVGGYATRYIWYKLEELDDEDEDKKRGRKRYADFMFGAPNGDPTFVLELGAHGLRFAACWLLWAGLLFSDTSAFCPSKGAMERVTLLWFFTPVVDHLWRGLASPCKEAQEQSVDEEGLMGNNT